ncbi:MAG: hypothetical protein JXA11_00720 [Phycisphaerae bacterium]|nr:hypothetical protein [Phycisphaerae bacterium]
MREMLTEWMLWLRRRGAPPSRRAVMAAMIPGLLITVGVTLLVHHAGSENSPPSAATNSPNPSAVPGEALSALRDSVHRTDVWSTASQRTRTWQVAKMETLSRLLSSFPAIREATVLLESGREAKLSVAGSPTKAAVHLVLEPQATMTPGLLRAVIDQTAGAISDLSPEQVRVIDNAGRSYTLADVSTISPDPRQLRQAEARWRDHLRSALAYIQGLTIVAKVQMRNGEMQCSRVLLSLPYSHAETIYRRGGAEGAGPRELILDGIVRRETDRVRRVAAVVAEAPLDRITVEWHYDVSPSAQAPVPVDSTSNQAFTAIFMGILACAEGCLLAGIVVRRVRRRRRRLAWSRVRAIAQRRRERLNSPEEETPEAFDAILQADLDDLVTLLSIENSQTVAMVLSHLSPARAAKVLSRLSADKQAEVAWRIAELAKANPETLRQAERNLTRRWAGRQTQRPADGITAVARILQHAGKAGRKNVLETLQQHQPDLAEKISRRLLCFEDLASLDPDHLAGALGSLSGEELALALWTADETVRPPLTAALSPAQREAMEEAAEQMGPVRLSQVESAQQHIVDVVREFETCRLAWAAAGKDEQMA